MGREKSSNRSTWIRKVDRDIKEKKYDEMEDRGVKGDLVEKILEEALQRFNLENACDDDVRGIVMSLENKE